MYIASKVPNQDFAVFEEIRTREEPDGKQTYYCLYLIMHKFKENFLNAKEKKRRLVTKHVFPP